MLPLQFNRVFRRERPLIEVYDDVITEHECDWVIDYMRVRVRPSTVIQHGTGNSVPEAQTRSSSGFWFSKGQHALVNSIEARVAGITGIPAENFEGMQVLRYEVGQRYIPHWDYFYEDQPSFQRLAASGGQRVATALLYLNTPDGGGDTSFPNLSLNVAARRGKMLYFRYDYDAETNKLTLHGGEPVTAGVKWVATLWARKRRWN